MVTVSGGPGTRRNTGGKITKFKLAHTDFDGGILWCMFFSSFCQNDLNLLRRLVLQGKKNLDASTRLHVLKSRASPEIFFQPLHQEETCNSAHEQIPFSNDTIDFVLRQREVRRAKELSAPPRISKFHAGRRIKIICPISHCEKK